MVILIAFGCEESLAMAIVMVFDGYYVTGNQYKPLLCNDGSMLYGMVAGGLVSKTLLQQLICMLI